ncbi:MAG TPA: RDD family protein [Candidatus Angelobacter sp.]|nr:RDD family protein [Candidatus Angelobacter sp.]
MWSSGAPAPNQPAPIQPTQTAAPAYSPQPTYAQPVVYAPAPSSPYGGFWIRFLAYIIDRLILGIVATPLYFILIMPRLLPFIQDAESNGEPSPQMIAALVGAGVTAGCLVLIGAWLYEALLTCSSWQGTIGKKVLRLKVTDEAGNRIGFGRSTGRFFAKIISTMIMYIGFIMVGFTDRKRGLHDMIAGTLVTKY